MDAKALLKGMGWTEGQGLGKCNQGIAEAIKPKVHLDRNGLGSNPAASLVEPWWAKVFNQTAKNVSVGEVPDVIAPKKKRASEHSRTENAARAIGRTKNDKRKSKKGKKMEKAAGSELCGVTESDSMSAHIASINKSLYLGSFTKGTTLTPGQSVTSGNLSTVAEGSEATVCDNRHLNPIDEELWKSCKGRTAHKGARYGVLKGKMARIVRQEQAMASKFYDTSS